MMTTSSLNEVAAALEQANIDLDKYPLEFENESARIRTLRAAKKLSQKLETAPELQRRLAWQEAAHAASIKIALNLGLFSKLKGCGRNNSLSSAELSKAVHVDEELTSRILRHLASWGTLKEAGLNRYSGTTISEAFLEPTVASGIEFFLHMASRGLASLPFFLEEKGYKDISNGVWERATGTDKPLFGWLGENPVAFEGFRDFMVGFTEGRSKWTKIYPVERLLEGSEAAGPLMVDVGGGSGQDVAIVQQAYPQPKGRLFVQDMPHVVEEAKKSGLDPVIEAQDHDFFTPQSIVGARAYLLHYILHDWPDDVAVKILQNLLPAMKKDYSRVLIVEMVVAAQNPDPFSTALDLLMMAIPGAKERTEEDWRRLVERAGMKIVKMWSLPNDHENVIEIVPT